MEDFPEWSARDQREYEREQRTMLLLLAFFSPVERERDDAVRDALLCAVDDRDLD